MAMPMYAIELLPLMQMAASSSADKKQEPYSATISYIQCKLSLALIRAAGASLRGHRHRVSSDANDSARFAVAMSSIG